MARPGNLAPGAGETGARSSGGAVGLATGRGGGRGSEGSANGTASLFVPAGRGRYGNSGRTEDFGRTSGFDGVSAGSSRFAPGTLGFSITAPGSRSGSSEGAVGAGFTADGGNGASGSHFGAGSAGRSPGAGGGAGFMVAAAEVTDASSADPPPELVRGDLRRDGSQTASPAGAPATQLAPCPVRDVIIGTGAGLAGIAGGIVTASSTA